ncbi:hypothetical protein RyT2_23880 [Pseudolactococcus yaeyamensis]
MNAVEQAFWQKFGAETNIEAALLGLNESFGATKELARLEGGSDLSIAYWQAVHRDFFKTAFAKEKLTYTYDEENLALIYEEFEVVYQ